MLAAMIVGKLKDLSHGEAQGHRRMEKIKSDDGAINDSTQKK